MTCKLMVSHLINDQTLFLCSELFVVMLIINVIYLPGCALAFCIMLSRLNVKKIIKKRAFFKLIDSQTPQRDLQTGI